MGWIIYFAVFVAVIAVGSKLFKKEERNSNKGKMWNGIYTIFLLMLATVVAIWVTNELGFSLGGSSSRNLDQPSRPGVGPYEW